MKSSNCIVYTNSKIPRNEKDFTENTINDNNMNSNSINQDFLSNQSKLNKTKKPIYQSNINDYDTKYNSQNKAKINTKNPMSNLNSKLSPENYIKPLYYLLNGQIKPVNKQFLGYRDWRKYLYGHPYPTDRIDEARYKLNSSPREEKKENNNVKHKNNKTENKKNKGKKSSMDAKTLKSKNNKNMKNKISSNNKNNVNKNNNNGSNVNKSKEVDIIKNQNATLIQACFRGYVERIKLYNSLSKYSRFKNDIKILDRINQYKSTFFNNLKQFSLEYQKNKNNLTSLKSKNGNINNINTNLINGENINNKGNNSDDENNLNSNLNKVDNINSISNNLNGLNNNSVNTNGENIDSNFNKIDNMNKNQINNNEENINDSEEKTTEELTTEEITTEEITTEEPTTEELNIPSNDKKILVLNSTSTNGLASKWMNKLSGAGFTNISKGNYSNSKDAQTTIYVAEEGMGKDLVPYFYDAQIVVGSLDSGIDVSTSGVDIFIVIGSNDINVQ